jgi:zinc protease
MAAVRKYYGDWQRGPRFPDLPPHKPLSSDKFVVVDTSPTRGLASVSFIFRGPDTGLDAASTYGADVWGQMINDPEGRFKNAVFKAVPELHGGTRHISAGYATQRDGGTSSFSFTVTVPEKPGLSEIITRLRTAVIAEIAAMTGPDYFAPAALAAAKQELENYDILSRETAAGSMANLSFWWASTSTDYYRDYRAQIQRVSLADVQAYVRNYLQQHFLTSIWINKDDEQRHRLSRRLADQNR